jgi:hypothetical protein
MNRKLYPANWEDIARRVKQAANWHCQECGKPCLLPGEDWLDFVIRCSWTVGEALAALEDNGSTNPTKISRYILTTAHLDHKPENCDRPNLRSWCAPCHCRYDLQFLKLKGRLRLERAGQLNLFDLSVPTPAGHGKEPNRLQIPIRLEVDHAT